MPVFTNRDEMVASFPHGGVVAEIGVQRGDFAETIRRLNEPLLLFLIDCWETQPISVYGHDPANIAQAQQDANYELVKERFEPYEEVRVIRSFSVPASKVFTDENFDWIYLDANHLRLRADLEAWWPKLKPGGWMSGHDYTIHDDYIYVKPVIDHWVREYNLELHVVTEEEFPSWAFQKVE